MGFLFYIFILDSVKCDLSSHVIINMIDDLLAYVFNSIFDGIASSIPLDIKFKSKKDETAHYLDMQYENWQDAMEYIDNSKTYIQKLDYIFKINDLAISIYKQSTISDEYFSDLIHIRKHIYDFISNMKLIDKNDIEHIIHQLEQISIQCENNQDVNQYIKEMKYILNH